MGIVERPKSSVMMKKISSEKLFGNHIRETMHILQNWFKKKSKTAVPLTEKAVKAYLNRCIKAWNNKEKEAKTLEDTLIAKSHIDAFQNVKESLFG